MFVASSVNMMSIPTILLCVATIAYAQEDNTKVIESFHVRSDIRFRFATTTMTSVVRNTAPEAQEVTFDVVLPKEAFIMHFAMTIDGKTYDGEVKEKVAAKQQYQEAVDRGQSAGHVRQTARHANMFEVSVNVANGSAVNFTLSYQELLARTRGVYEYELHVQPGQPVEDFKVDVYIQETKPILYVRTPALRSGSLITNEIEEVNSLTVIERPSAETALVEYTPSLADQGEKGVAGRFVVQYDVEHGPTGDLMVVDGYFVHFFSPDLPPMPKDIIFVLDLSGSMSGEKLTQLKKAMKVILDDLQEQDRFNIITFSSDVQKWVPEMLYAGDELVIDRAQNFVKDMTADGMTNINQALLTAVKELAAVETSDRASLVFFLTDGQPTEGVRNSKQIALNVRTANEKDVAILSLAFGSGADFDSLKTISAQNSGFARKIYDASDAALQVSNLYNEVSAVIMKDLTVSYLPSAVDEFTVTKNEFPVVFNGTEVIICGFMSRAKGRFVAEITGLKKTGEIDLVFETDDVTNFVIDADEESDPDTLTTPRDLSGLVERMWAYISIKQLLKERERQATNETLSEELKKKIIDMSLKYRLVTPLTSMVVTKPDSEEKDQASLQDADDISEADSPAYAHSFVPNVMGSIAGRKRYSRTRSRHRPKVAMAGLPGLLPSYYNNYPISVMHDPMPMPDPMPTRSYIPRTPRTPRYMMTRLMRATTTTTSTPPPPPTITTAATTRRPTTVPPQASSKESILAALAVFMPSQSVCLAPKKLHAGIYTLFKLRDDVFQLETYCAARNCRLTGVKMFNVSGSSGHLTVFISQSGQNWRYAYAQTHTGYDVIVKPRALTIKGKGIDIRIKRHKGKKVDRYVIFVNLTKSGIQSTGSEHTYSVDGIINRAVEMATDSPRRKKKRTPRACAKIQAASVFLTRRLLNKHNLMSYVYNLN